jgi:hypothetical protein
MSTKVMEMTTEVEVMEVIKAKEEEEEEHSTEDMVEATTTASTVGRMTT